MKHITTIHGISAGGTRERRGYSLPFVRTLTNVARPLLGPAFSPTVGEVEWAGLAQSLAPDIEALPDGLELVADYALDIVTYKRNTAQIKAHVRSQIKPGGVVVAHSWGSVIAFDLLLDELRADRLTRHTAPADRLMTGLVTIGSPLGIWVPGLNAYGCRDRNAAAQAVPTPPRDFEWLNFADDQDVVCTGSPLKGAPPLDMGSEYAGYVRMNCSHYEVDSGWFHDSHNGYWDLPTISQFCLGLMGGVG